MTTSTASAGYACSPATPSRRTNSATADRPTPVLAARTPPTRAHAREFDGAWPYLEAIADAAGGVDPLDDDGGAHLLGRRPAAATGRPDCAAGPAAGRVRRAGHRLLDDSLPGQALAHHSFHVFVVYPWVRFLDRDPRTPLRVMQDCRIRWGTVESVDDDHAVIVVAPLTFDDGTLGARRSRARSGCGGARTARRWRRRRHPGRRSSPRTGTGCAAP